MTERRKTIERAERLLQDTDNGLEIWRAVVDGRPVQTTVIYAEYRPVWGRVLFRDFVLDKLENAA